MRRLTGHSALSVSASTLCVAPERVKSIWPHVEIWIEDAVERCGDWTVAEIYSDLLSGSMLLWVRWDGTALKSAAVSHVTLVPKGKVCRIIACGGSSDGDWKAALSPIESYAKEIGCAAMRIHGRPAWSKVFNDYDLEWVALEKRLT